MTPKPVKWIRVESGAARRLRLSDASGSEWMQAVRDASRKEKHRELFPCVHARDFRHRPEHRKPLLDLLPPGEISRRPPAGRARCSLFVPFGYLLPLLWRRADRWWKVVLCGFVLSLGIELIQLVTHLGMFDLDDLMNNSLELILGWCFLLFGAA